MVAGVREGAQEHGATRVAAHVDGAKQEHGAEARRLAGHDEGRGPVQRGRPREGLGSPGADLELRTPPDRRKYGQLEDEDEDEPRPAYQR